MTTQLETVLHNIFDPLDEVPGGLVDAAVQGGYSRRRRARLAVASLAILLFVVVSAVIVTQPGSRKTRSLQVGPGPIRTLPTTPTSAVASELTPAVSGDTVALFASGDVLFAVVRPDPASRGSIVMRLEAGKQVRSEPLDAAGSLTLTAGVLWVADWPIGPAPNFGHLPEVVGLDPATLTVRRRIPLPEVAVYPSVAGIGSDLWAATPTHLYRIDPADGALLARVTLPPGDANATPTMALDPLARWLWVAQPGVAASTPLVVTKRNVSNGAVIGEQSDLASVAGGTVFAVNTGVWVIRSKGTSAGAAFLDATDLTIVHDGVVGSNTTVGVVTAAHLVLFADPVSRSLSCFGVRNPTAHIGVPVGSAYSALAQVGDTVYLGSNVGLYRLPLLTGCG